MYIVKESYYDSGRTHANLTNLKALPARSRIRTHVCDIYFTACRTLSEAKEVIRATLNA